MDHLRALVYLAADGAPPPGKGGRRRLMRILIRKALAQMKVLNESLTKRTKSGNLQLVREVGEETTGYA